MSILESLLELAQTIQESKMSELDANIRDLFKDNENILSIEEPHIYSYKGSQGIRQFIVSGVVYNKKDDKSGERRSGVPAKKAFKSGKQEYQDFVFHPIDSLEVKRGLPRKKGGDILRVDHAEYLTKRLKELKAKPQDDQTKGEIEAIKAEIDLYNKR